MSNYLTDAVYKCTVCNNINRVPVNREGIDVLPRCNITMHCTGKLQRIVSSVELSSSVDLTYTQSPNWVQRKLLYTHDQKVNATSWTITHNLGGEPRVYVYRELLRDGVATIVPETPKKITVTSANQVVLTFEYPIAGSAQCIVSTTQTTSTGGPLVAASTAENTTTITSTNGEMTIATLDDNRDVTIEIEYGVLGAVNSLKITYSGVDNIPSIDTPWLGTSKVLINNKRYTVRSFNIAKTNSVVSYFLSGRVKNGDFLRILSINNKRVAAGDCLILLGRPPYGIVDRINNQFIDASSVSIISPELTYANSEVQAKESIIRTTYPTILTL